MRAQKIERVVRLSPVVPVDLELLLHGVDGSAHWRNMLWNPERIELGFIGLGVAIKIALVSKPSVVEVGIHWC